MWMRGRVLPKDAEAGDFGDTFHYVPSLFPPLFRILDPCAGPRATAVLS